MCVQGNWMITNLASEDAVLSGLIQYGTEAFIDIDGFVQESTFVNNDNKVIFKCLENAFKKDCDKIDYSMIRSSSQTLGLDEIFKRDGFSDKLDSLFNLSVGLDSIRDHGKKISRLEFARKMQSECKNIYENIGKVSGDEKLSEIFSLAEAPFQKISLSYMKEEETTPQLIGSDIHEYVKSLLENKPKPAGIPSGLSEYDKAIGGGFRRKCVDLIGARPKTGKSILADNFALNISSNLNIPVLMLDTEMSKTDHHNRLLSNLSGVEINQISDGSFQGNQEHINRVLEASNKIDSIPYSYISIAGKQFDEILSTARRWVLKEVGYDENGVLNDCLIVFDYLKLMDSSSINGNLAEFQVLGFQITALHNFCVEHDCPCVAFVQLNRDGITKETSDVASGSDRLVWLCTSFTIFKDKTQDEINTDGHRNGNKKLIIVASRHGPGMEDEGYVCLEVHGSLAKVKEIGTIRSLKNNENSIQQGFPDKEDCPFEADGDGEDF